MAKKKWNTKDMVVRVEKELDMEIFAKTWVKIGADATGCEAKVVSITRKSDPNDKRVGVRVG